MTDTASTYGPLDQLSGGGADVADLTPLSTRKAHDLANRMTHLMAVNPMLAQDLPALRSIALMPQPLDELAQNAAALYGSMKSDGMKARLESSAPEVQRMIFNQMTPLQQQALGQQGYAPPSADGGAWSGGLLSDLKHGALEGVGKGLSAGFGLVNTALHAPGVKQGLDVLQWASDQSAHLYRAIRILPSERQLLSFGAGLAAAGLTAAAILGAPETGGLSLTGLAGVSGLAGLGVASATAAATGPQDWASAWKDTMHGERVFDRGARAHAAALLGGDERLTNLAVEIAGNGDLAELASQFAGVRDAARPDVYAASVVRVAKSIMAEGDPRFQTLVTNLSELARTPKFREAVDVLQQGKVSFGRDIARAVHLPEGSRAYSMLSGALDAAWLFTMDPTLHLGQIAEMNRIRRYLPAFEGLTKVEAIERVRTMAAQDVGLGRWYDEVARNADQLNQAGVARVASAARGIGIDLVEAARQAHADGKVFDRNAMFDWMQSGTNVETLLGGHGVARGYGQLVLPKLGISLGPLYVPTYKLRLGLSAAFDMANDNHLARSVKTAIDDLSPLAKEGAPWSAGGGLNPQTELLGSVTTLRTLHPHIASLVDTLDKLPLIGSFERQLGNLGFKATHFLPMSMAIRTAGPGASEEIWKWTNMAAVAGMRSWERDGWLNAIVAAPDLPARMDAMIGMLDTMLTGLGGKMTPELKDVTDRFVNHLHQAYGASDTGVLDLGEGIFRQRGNWTLDLTSDLPMPDFKKMRQLAHKGLLLPYVYRMADSHLVETGMDQVWKPSVLLRVGFIPRAAGEELLAHLARYGLGGLLHEFGARAVAEGRLYDDTVTKAIGLNGQALGQLSKAERDVLARLRYVAHVRPIERILQSFDFTKPWVDQLGRYSDWLRSGLDRGLFPDAVDRLPAKFRNLVAGDPSSFRSLLARGANEDLVRHAYLWQARYSDSVMKELSAGNANIWSVAKTDQIDDVLLPPWQDPRTGQMVEMKFKTVRGHAKRYHANDMRDDPLFARMGFYQTQRHFDDAVWGQDLADALTHYMPRELAGWTADGTLQTSIIPHYLQLDVTHQRLAHELLAGPDAHAGLPVFISGLAGGSPAERDLYDRLVRAVNDPHEWQPLDVVQSLMDHTPASHRAELHQLADLRDVLHGAEPVPAHLRHWLVAHLFDARQYASTDAETGRVLFDTARYVADQTTELPQMYAQLVDRMVESAMRPQNQGIIQQADWANRTADHRIVQNPLHSAQERIWIPALHPDDAQRLIDLLARSDPEGRSALITEIAGRMWANGDHLPQHEWDQLSQFAGVDLPAWLHEVFAPNYDGWQRVVAGLAMRDSSPVVPLAAAGVDNPDLAHALSATLAGALHPAWDQAAGAQGITDEMWAAIGDATQRPARGWIDRSANTKQLKVSSHGVDEVALHAVPHYSQHGMWLLDPEMAAPRTEIFQPFDQVQVVNGQVHVGIPLELAVREHVERLVNDELRLLWEPGAHLEYTAKQALWSDANHAGPAIINPGQKVGEGTWFTASGQRASLDDRELFDHTTGVATRRAGASDLNWQVLGPIALDNQEARVAAFRRFYRDTTPLVPERKVFLGRLHPNQRIAQDLRTVGGGTITADEVAARRLEADGARAYRAHYAQWNDLPDPPRVVVGPVLQAIGKDHIWDRVKNGGFAAISSAIDAVARRPMAFHFFHEAMTDNERVFRWLRSPDIFERQMGEVGLRLGHQPGDATSEATHLYEAVHSEFPDLAKLQEHQTLKAIQQSPTLHALAIDLGADHQAIAAGRARLAEIRARRAEIQQGVAQGDRALVAEDEQLSREAVRIGHLLTDAVKPENLNLDQVEPVVRTFIRAAKNDEHALGRAAELAGERAVINGLQYVDSHEIRTQLGEAFKAFSPFWYAEENFMRRWARTLKVNPSAIRQAQLLYGGLKSGGLIRTDGQGKDWFVYPGSGFVTEVVGKIPGMGAVLPAGAVFATQPQNMLPGFNPDQTGVPQLSPLVAIPLQRMTGLFPELTPLARTALGDSGLNRSALGQFVPSVLRNLYESALGGPDTSRKYASAMVAAAQTLEATGHGLPDGASPQDRDEYIRRLRDSTRTILLMQTLGAFILPGSPQTQFTGESNTSLSHLTGVGAGNPARELRDEYQRLVHELGIEGAATEFVKNHADGGLRHVVRPEAYMVSQSESAAGAPVPATTDALAFYDNHQAWFAQHGPAAAWLLPGDQGDKFSQYAYNQELIAGLREKRSPKDFVDMMKFKEGSTLYFTTKDQFDALIADAKKHHKEGLANALQARWSEYQDSFMQTHPIFTDHLLSGDARQRRSDTIDQLRLIVADPATPVTSTSAPLGQLVKAYDTYVNERQRLELRRTTHSLQRVDQLKVGFQQWVDHFLVANPQLQALWTSVYRPEAGLD